jgi:superfamily I DNA/RNA helicase
LKNELVDFEAAKAKAANHIEKTIAEAYALYQDRLRRANALDFDDLIMTTVTLLQLFPEVAEHYQRRFRHVLVDEYQDTNHAQYVLVKELVGAGDGKAELCVVGDADQSIYAFRGATIRNILQFEADYPDATVVLLEQNYRSTQTILSAANAVISKNPDRKPKRLWSEAGDGARVLGYVAENEHDEAAWVAGEIERLGGRPLGGLEGDPRDVCLDDEDPARHLDCDLLAHREGARRGEAAVRVFETQLHQTGQSKLHLDAELDQRLALGRAQLHPADVKEWLLDLTDGGHG